MASSKISQKSGNLVFLIPATHVQALWDTFFTVTNTRLSDWIKIIQLKPMTKVDHLPVNLLRDGRRSVLEDWIVFLLWERGKSWWWKAGKKWRSWDFWISRWASLNFSVKFNYCCTIHCTTNFKLPVNSRNCQNFPTILCQLGGKL